MDERASRSLVEKVDRLLGLGLPQPWPWSRREWIATACSVIAILGFSTIIILDFVLGDARLKWGLVAVVVHQATLLAMRTADALYAGAFGGRFREQGRKARAAAYVAMYLASVIFVAAAGGSIAGSTGALVGGAAMTVTLFIAVLYDRRRHERARATRVAARSGQG